MLETDVHFPTDITLLLDAVRKVLTLVARLCIEAGIPGWRKWNYNVKKFKRLCRQIQNLKRRRGSGSKGEKGKAERDKQIKQAHESYISLVEFYLDRAADSLDKIKESGGCDVVKILEIEQIEHFMGHAYRQVVQIRRRVLFGESLRHAEKVFSVFEEHTEWISKGKAGVPQELGLRVCVLEDQHGFLLQHRVMEKESDDQVAVPMVVEVQKKFKNLKSCSFDKGFYSPGNREELRKLLDVSILAKKGRLSQRDKEYEHSEDFVKGREQHSAVESAINALENHGLDRCRDHGINGFKRYVGLAVLSRNIHILGNLLHHKKRKQLKRRERLRAKGAKGGGFQIPKAPKAA